MSELLKVEELRVTVEGKEILAGVSLTVKAGEIHALMGPNGSGKSTLAHVLMGHPKFQVTGGRILYQGADLTALKPDQRAKQGLFLAFQYPMAIPGVTVANFIRTALKSLRGAQMSVKELRQQLQERMKLLGIPETFLGRYVNDGFSGGEKKRLEILQMAMFGPKLAVLDETDSGLDIDALQVVANGITRMAGPNIGILLITHYQRILNYVKPHVVHVLMRGRVVRSGGPELAHELEAKGYDWIPTPSEEVSHAKVHS